MKKGELGASVGIIGTGRVGTAIAFSLLLKEIANEIVLVGHRREQAEGEAMDLDHGALFTQAGLVRAGEYKDLKDLDFIVITAGASQREGDTRLDLLDRNVEIMKDIIPKAVKYNKKAIYIMVSNPVDVLTYVTLKLSGLPKNQVIGSGTALDSSRFRYLLGQKLSVSPHNVHAYILGEHGDSELPAVSCSYVSGLPLKSFPGSDDKLIQWAFENTKNAAYQVIERKGSTFWAIGVIVAGIIKNMIYDDNVIMPVSTLLEGEYGLRDVCLSVPVKIGANGASEIIPFTLNSKEQKALEKSAETLKQAISRYKFT